MISCLALASIHLNSQSFLSGIAGAGGGGIVSMAQIVMSDVVSLRDRYVLVLVR